MVYKEKVKIHLTHTDAAGIIFHGRIFELTDMIYEDMLEDTNISFSKVLKEGKALLLVVNCNANFHKSVIVGDKLNVEGTVEKVGTSSFVMFYQFKNEDGILVMDARTTLVYVDKATKKAIPIPSDVVKAFNV